MASFLRTVYVMLTVVVVCLAVFEGVGRVVVANLAAFEPKLNEVLAPRGIRFEKVSGDWRYLNPIIRAERVTFPGGELSRLAFELDVLESLFRNRIVARVLTVDDSYIAIEETPRGWRLKGADPDSRSIDLSGLARHSDAVRVSSRIEIFRGDASASIFASATAANRGGYHRARLKLAAERTCEDCELVAAVDTLDALWGIREEQGSAFVVAKGFGVTENVAGLWELPGGIVALNGTWTKGGADERAALEVAVSSIGGDDSNRFAGRLSAWRDGAGYQGVAEQLYAATAQLELELEPIAFRTKAADAVEVWTESVDVAGVAAFVAEALGSDTLVGTWLHELAPRGRLSDLRTRIDEDGVAFAAAFDELELTSYKGAPELGGASGSLAGHQRAIEFHVNSASLRLGFPMHFDNVWTWDRARGSFVLWFDREYMGWRGDGLEIEFADAKAVGGFALSRPRDPAAQRLTILTDISEIDVPGAKAYMPRRLPGELKPWLEKSILAGRVSDAAFIYHGHLRAEPGRPLRLAAISGSVAEGAVDYHGDWPRVTEANGVFEVTGRETRAHISTAMAYGRELRDVVVVVPNDATYADVAFATRMPVSRALSFVWDTPVHEYVPYVSADWRGAGVVSVIADLHVPLRGQQIGSDDLDIDFELHDASLDLRDLGIRFSQLEGAGVYRSPNYLAAQELTGRFFDEPVLIGITAGDASLGDDLQPIEFNVRGKAAVPDVYAILGMADLDIARGAFDFDASYRIFTGTKRPPELRVTSDLAGVEVGLPAPLGKRSEETRNIEVELQFTDDYLAASLISESASGWMHLDGSEILRGSVGLDAEPLVVASDSDEVVVTGAIDALVLGAAQAADAFAWRASDLRIGIISVGNFEITDAIVNGGSNGSGTDVTLRSREVDGSFSRDGQQPWRIHLNELRLPEALDEDAESVDPLSPSAIDDLMAADVQIDRILFRSAKGDDDYGTWAFNVRPEKEGVRLTDLAANIKGLAIEASEDAWWVRDGNQSRFNGSITGGNLAAVLPEWGYMVNIESASIDVTGDLRWPGSPLAFALERLSGSATMRIGEGRFVDVDQGGGAVRLVGLLNFSAIVKRMKLNFSDVVAKGVSFNEIYARTAFDDGILTFEEPMVIDGHGSLFRVNGTIDLETGALDNEMVVTLPVDKSLPWYAAYIGLANPAAGVGVLIGQRIFGSQIESLSSGKYRIRGTLDAPEVEFVNIFTKDMERTVPEQSSEPET